jgi:hypothetical protein
LRHETEDLRHPKDRYFFNDEFFFPAGLGGISGVYHDEQEAQQAFMALEVAEIRQRNLGLTEQLSGSNYQEVRQQLHEYLQTILPQPLFTLSESDETLHIEIDTYLPRSLTDEQIIRIREILSLQYHEMCVFEDEAVFYAIWLPQEGKFLGPNVGRYEQYKNAVYFFNTYEEALGSVDRLGYLFSEKLIRVKIEELSDNPMLVRSLNEGNRVFQYFEDEAYIQLTYRPNGEDLIAFNALLKEPLFEIRTFPLEEAAQIAHEAFEIV